MSSDGFHAVPLKELLNPQPGQVFKERRCGGFLITGPATASYRTRRLALEGYALRLAELEEECRRTDRLVDLILNH